MFLLATNDATLLCLIGSTAEMYSSLQPDSLMIRKIGWQTLIAVRSELNNAPYISNAFFPPRLVCKCAFLIGVYYSVLGIIKVFFEHFPRHNRQQDKRTFCGQCICFVCICVPVCTLLKGQDIRSVQHIHKRVREL